MSRQLYACLVAVGPRVVDARTKCSKQDVEHRQMTFMDKDARED